MKRRQALLLSLIIASTATFATQPVIARDKTATNLEQAAKIAKEKDKDRVLSARSKKENGKEVYQVKILDEKGHVKTVRVPASDK